MPDSLLHLSEKRAAKSLVQLAALNAHRHARCEDDLDGNHANGAIAHARTVRCRRNRYGQKCWPRLMRIKRSGAVTRSPVVQAAAANAVLLSDGTNRCAFAKAQLTMRRFSSVGKCRRGGRRSADFDLAMITSR